MSPNDGVRRCTGCAGGGMIVLLQHRHMGPFAPTPRWLVIGNPAVGPTPKLPRPSAADLAFLDDRSVGAKASRLPSLRSRIRDRIHLRVSGYLLEQRRPAFVTVPTWKPIHSPTTASRPHVRGRPQRWSEGVPPSQLALADAGSDTPSREKKGKKPWILRPAGPDPSRRVSTPARKRQFPEGESVAHRPCGTRTSGPPR
jgi:hypothetical protein